MSKAKDPRRAVATARAGAVVPREGPPAAAGAAAGLVWPVAFCHRPAGHVCGCRVLSHAPRLRLAADTAALLRQRFSQPEH